MIRFVTHSSSQRCRGPRSRPAAHRPSEAGVPGGRQAARSCWWPGWAQRPRWLDPRPGPVSGRPGGAEAKGPPEAKIRSLVEIGR